MAQPTLEIWEVALIKAMLARGYANKDVQFFFNRPDRAVNSGRVSEIKGGDRWAEVGPADDHDLDEFLDHHPSANPYRPDGEPELPTQRNSASQFRIDADGRIGLSNPGLEEEVFADPMVVEAYEELRSKANDMLALNGNHLGEVKTEVEAFSVVLPENPIEASAVRVWMRGNALRYILRAHEQVAGQDEFHPAKLDPLCSNKLSDLVQAFNVFAVLVPKLVEIDQNRLGPDGTQEVKQAVDEFSLLLPDVLEISTEEAQRELSDEVAAASVDLEGAEIDRQISLTGNTAYNFLLSAIKGAYRWVRRTAGTAVKEFWAGTKGDVYRVTGLAMLGGIWGFLSLNYPAIASILEKLSANPVAKQLLDLIASLFG